MKYIYTFLAVWLMVGCSKDPSKITTPPKPVIEEERTDEQKLLDEVYSQYKYLSLWESAIEDADPVSSLTDKYTNYNVLLRDLKNQTPKKLDYEFHKDYAGPLDRFSWIEELSSSGQNSSKADVADGYGVYLTFDPSRGDSLFVYFVEGGSPGFKSSVSRGDKILKMNGDEAMVYANRFKIESYLDGTNLEIITESTAHKKNTHKLVYTTYVIDPIIESTTFQQGNKNIGYLALSSFEEIENESGAKTTLFNTLENIFNQFEAKNITDLIVDLRYNTGGYVNTAIYLNNKIINSTGDGKVMFTYEVNKNLEVERKNGNKDFVPENFKRNNTTEIKNVYFLVSDLTASASEIVISALKPYTNVQIIAEYQSTYGKPVGFFREDINDKIGLWAASFKIVNAAGFTDYWDGIAADEKNVFDNIYLPLGDPQENMIKSALTHITTGAYSKLKSSARASIAENQSVIQHKKYVNHLHQRNLLKD